MAFEYDPTEKAKQLMKKYDTHDPDHLADRLGFILVDSDLGETTYAERDYFCRITVITLNTRISEGWRRFVLLHEIGHAVLHQGFSTAFYRQTLGAGMINWAEKDASQFAMQLELANFDPEDLKTMTDYQIIDSMGLDDYNLIRFLH